MNAQDIYNELLEDGFKKEWLDFCVELGISLPRSIRYQNSHPEEPDF